MLKLRSRHWRILQHQGNPKRRGFRRPVQFWTEHMGGHGRHHQRRGFTVSAIRCQTRLARLVTGGHSPKIALMRSGLSAGIFPTSSRARVFLGGFKGGLDFHAQKNINESRLLRNLLDPILGIKP